MSTQGAIQIQVVINNQSITIKKDHLVSLKVSRVIGDSANEFTLEAFDETAWKLENALMNEELAPISVCYSAANDLTKVVKFSGICVNYQLSFVGKSTMLTITGILSSSSDIAGYWFTSQAIEWVGGYVQNSDGTYDIDGKNQATWSGYETNEDVCAIMAEDAYGEMVPFYNPTRIFKRIIHKYNGDKLGSVSGTSKSVSYSNSSDAAISSSSSTNTVWHFYRERGLTEQATAAIMGNIQQENSFSPSSNSGGLGIFQYIGGRKTACIEYAESHNYNYESLIAQLEFMYNEDAVKQFEVYTGPNYPKRYSEKISPSRAEYGWGVKMSWDDFKKLTDVDLAAQIFSQVFERPGTPRLENRQKYARKYYSDYSSSNSSAGTTKVTIKNIQRYSQPSLTSVMANEYVPNGTSVKIITTTGNFSYIEYNNTKTWVLTYELLGTEAPISTTSTTSTVITSGSAVEGWGTGGTGKFKLGDCDESRWVKDLQTVQSPDQTAAQYINQVLCKAAIANTGKEYKDEVAGFSYYVDAKGHNFKMLKYNETPDSSNTVRITYGQQNSEIISFSLAKVGTIAMVGLGSNSSSIVDTSGLDYLYGDLITSAGEKVLGSGATTDSIKQNAAYANWYSAQTQSVYVSSSSSKEELTSVRSKTWTDLQSLTFSADLTVWGSYSNKYKPGNYLDITIVDNKGVKHYASGVYMILKIEDSVSVDGYTQTMKLLKNTAQLKIDYGTSEESSNTEKSTETTVTSYTSTYEDSNTPGIHIGSSSVTHGGGGSNTSSGGGLSF